MRIRAKEPVEKPKASDSVPPVLFLGAILLFSSYWLCVGLEIGPCQQAFTLTRRFLLHRGWVVKLKK